MESNEPGKVEFEIDFTNLNEATKKVLMLIEKLKEAGNLAEELASMLKEMDIEVFSK